MGHVVKECHIPLWADKVDKTGCLGGSKGAFLLLLRLLTVYTRLLFKYLSAGHYDVILVGYPGHLDVLIAKCLEYVSGRRKKIVFDAFISLHDTIVCDRRMVKAGSVMARIIFQLDRIACLSSDVLLLDTDAHADYFQNTFGVPAKKLFTICASADTSVFYPRKRRKKNGAFRVLFWGKYTPLHGIEHIVEAARQLRNQESIRFVFIGRGQIYRRIRALVEDYDLHNIEFIEWVPYEALPAHIQAADVCLGIFSTSAKANRVVPNKIFQAMAMAKPVISGRTDAVEACLTHMENIFLCNPGDPADLSGAIMTLKSDAALTQRISVNALETFETDLSDKMAVDVLKKVLSHTVGMGTP
jgi:glycosyltransferase involved in cell wall biosynthesis